MSTTTILIVCPVPRGSRKGNRVTAERWKNHLQAMGHRVRIAGDWNGQRCDVLLALHAKKSYEAIRRYRRERPSGPLVVALTGTDIYRDLPKGGKPLQSLRWADRLIALHDAICDDLPAEVHAKVRVIHQSTLPVSPRPNQSQTTFDVCVLGHLRHEKDPLRTAMALRLLRDLPDLRLTQAGQALSPRYAAWARAMMQHDRRYRWLGEIPRRQALRLLASSHLMVISSRMEGGANVVSEAIVNGVPILASDISGNRGLLGPDYPGYFPVGDTASLARLLRRTCVDSDYRQALTMRIAALAPRFTPESETAALKALLRELV